MSEYERYVMDLFRVTEWDEELLNQRALDLYEGLRDNADIQRCIKFMRENYTMAGYIDDTVAFYLLLSQEYFDAMKPCIDVVKAGGTLSEEAFAAFCVRVK